jgi:hypothetical protein
VRNAPLARTDPSGWADDKPSKTWEPFKGGYFMTTFIVNAPEPRGASPELRAAIADAFTNVKLPNNSAGGTGSDTSTLASAARDTGRAAYHVGMEAHPLVSVASSIATAYDMAGEVLGMLGVQQPDRLPVLSEKLRLKYETPAYGLVAEVGMGLLAGRAASGFGSGVRAVAVTAERDMFALGGAKAGPAMEPGAFSISNWNGYPAGVPKPQGTFRLLEGAEYTSARDAANTANKAIRKEQGLVGLDVDVHEVKPVKFNGSPTDPGNKLVLPRDVHRQQVTPWWNQLMRDISGQ